MSLSDYIRKRVFSQTPEPAAKTSAKTGGKQQLVFVVQKHHASSLHYDFRLEMDGVLKSWSVPKGPVMDPAVKRLAVEVEDHPYAYRTFEGDIPKGNYGAGHVDIWDQGTYEAEESGADDEKTLLAGLRKGHVSFVLHGSRLQGAFSLIRSPHMGDKAWLLIKKQSDEAQSMKLSETATERPMPSALKPMLATLVDKPFDDPDWLFEIKWDGYRAIANWNGEHASLASRSGQDYTSKYAPISQALAQLKHKAVLDGEIVMLDEQGRSHFGWLQQYGKGGQGQLAYMAFDVLWLNGHDLTGLPLRDRKELLQTLLGEGIGPIRYSDHIEGAGISFFAAAEKQHLEGVMAKHSVSTYTAGKRSEYWLKIKTAHRQEVVIAGFTEPKGSRKHIGALIVGVYRRGKLAYAGHVGGGFPPRELASLRDRLELLERKTSPFDEPVTPNAPVHWLKPELVCEVTFSEWTADKRMRQPIFVGLRNDKAPTHVTIENPQHVKRRQPSDKETTMQPSTHFDFTHPDKIFWPEAGLTKGDLLAYYQAVAKTMLPYLDGRPLSLLRHPDGYNGPSFFQKDIVKPPEGLQTKAIFSESTNEDVHYLIGGSWDALAYAVQLGSIEINPWNSTLKHIDKPDWVVIDLDPEGVTFEDVIRVAQATHKVCARYDIDTYPKTSGKTGIHVYIPLGAKYDYDQAQKFAHLLATLIHEEIPDITSLERSPAKRQHKIYLDYLQNRSGQTLAAPYSVRPAKDASVSAPLKWTEVRKGLRPEKFTIQNMPKRLEEVGDLWKPVLGSGVDLHAILKRMEAGR
jgi:bifunctional non-homologous end joining protein LigD